VAIARALFTGPKLLLCDEPTGNLDAATGAGVISLFEELHREGLTLLAVTHEERMSSAARRVLRLKEGRLVEEPRPALAGGAS
jgi:putative ABC transport system ATP-binding protein